MPDQDRERGVRWAFAASLTPSSRISPKAANGRNISPSTRWWKAFIYTPKTVTTVAPHARSYVDMKRIMTYVVIATIPCILMGDVEHRLSGEHRRLLCWVTESATGWRIAIIVADVRAFRWFNPSSIFANVHAWSDVFPARSTSSRWSRAVSSRSSLPPCASHEVNEGFLVTSMLYTLIMPATTPLWQVALGIIFGVVIGKEVFGGTGKNFLNPALVGPGVLSCISLIRRRLSGDSASGHPLTGILGRNCIGRVCGIGRRCRRWPLRGITWSRQHFSAPFRAALARHRHWPVIIGLAFLLMTKIANYRLIVGCLAGHHRLYPAAEPVIGSDTNPMFAMPWYWHIVSPAAYAFGLAFMVTEPVSASAHQCRAVISMAL